jgi:hypothetical protein
MGQLEVRGKSRPAVTLHILGTALAIILLFILLKQQGWEEILQAFQRITTWRLLVAIGLTFISRLAVAGRWHMLLTAVGVNIPFRQTLQVTFAGLFASHFLPTTVGGDVIRLAGVLRLGYARALSVASLVVDRLIGMAGMGMAAMGLLFQPLRLKGWPSLFDGLSFREGHFLFLTLSPLFAFQKSNTPWLTRLWMRIRELIQRLWAALFEWKKHPKALLASLGCTWIHMLCLFASIWLFMEPLGEEMEFIAIAGLWSLTYFVTLLPISVNGLGVQELSVTFFYMQFGGLRLSNALTIALLVRVIQMLVSLPGALFIPALLAGGRKKNTA